MYFKQLIFFIVYFLTCFLKWDTLMNKTYNKLYIHYLFNVNTNLKNHNYKEDAKRELQSLFV